MSSLLAIGKSGLLAAQIGLSTTGHNITNANVAGYSRQGVIQSTTPGQNIGVGFVGSGTEVAQIKRYYDSFLNNKLRGAEAQQASLSSYYSQISQIDNMMADTTAGLSPALQDFFKGVQDAASNPASTASRQALLSAAGSLTGRFQDLSSRLSQISEGVNKEITNTVTEINSYASQIAQINNDISGLSSDPAIAPNDLLDKRDQMLTELNKLIKVSVVEADNHTMTVSFGTGQPLVVGNTAFELTSKASATDPTRMVVGYQTNAEISQLPEDVLGGGRLGGLIEFRANALDRTQNSLGQIAAGITTSFNSQHQLGQDQNGALGTNFFSPSEAYVGRNQNNLKTSTAQVSAVVSNAGALTSSDYSVDYNGVNFTVTRLSDGNQTTIDPFPQTGPQTIDGVDYTITGTPATKDNFVVRPTYNAAADMNVLIKDRSKLALAAPIATSAPSSNSGNGKIDAGSVDAAYLTPGNALSSALTISFHKDPATNAQTLDGFPPGQDITVTANGSSTVYPAGTTPIPYTAGAAISFGGIHVSISGQPANNDSFVIGPNTSGVGDNRNGALLATLQTKNVLDNGNTTFQSEYAQMVNFIGNKTREAQISGLASDAAVNQAQNEQQTVSGVNLDEEAANLLRYQQAYQAAGKVMQIASQLFDTLLNIGN